MRWTLLGMVSAALATSLVRECPASANGVCYSVNVPDASASSGNGDIYFQIQGDSSLQWIGLGQGGQSQMRNSNLFIIYADDSGTNVTLSPRLGLGPAEPDFNPNAKVSLLEGSGIANGKMTANVRCSSCVSWGSGTMDLTSSNTQWIWAVKSGSPIRDRSQSVFLPQHDSRGKINFDLTVAKGGNSLNPFSVQASPSGSTNAPGATGSAQAGKSGSVGASSSGGEVDFQLLSRATIAHGTIMGLAFAFFFPIGAILIRVFSFPGLIWVHAATQIFAYLMAIAGLGLGVYIALKPERVIGTYHPVIGLIVVSLLVFQPALGHIHHFIFKRSGERNIWTTAHVWFGRILITLGIINGGLGLKLSDNTRGGEIAYGVVAGLIWLVWAVVAGWTTTNRSRREKRGVKVSGSHGSSDSEMRTKRGEEGIAV